MSTNLSGRAQFQLGYAGRRTPLAIMPVRVGSAKSFKNYSPYVRSINENHQQINSTLGTLCSLFEKVNLRKIDRLYID